MFVDRVRIRVTGGAGGNGCCSFLKEKFVDRGGPNGGDGGNGGDVNILATSRLTSLLDIRYHSHWKGERGVHGKGSDRHGKNATNTTISVPCGTVVHDFETNEILADLTDEGQTYLAGKGGRGGKGNARFATAKNKAPRFAELGEPGQEAEYRLELKLIAEVGLVGLPNAGKSTLLAAVSAARPKVADYAFTTLVPNLGVARLNDYRTLTIADIPGIIEGAAQGKGLGHDFLRHIERTQVLLFLLDLGDEDPVQTRRILEAELAEHSDVFATRPKFFALNKSDITENRERAEEVASHFDHVFVMSGATGEGIKPLLEALWETVDKIRREEPLIEAEVSEREYVFKAPFALERTRQGGFAVTGDNVLRAVRMTDFGNDEAVRYLQKRLELMGLFKALKRMGAKEGQTISIGDLDLEYHSD